MSDPKWEDTEAIEDISPSWDDTEEYSPVSALESAARGAAQGLSFGFADEIAAGLAALGDKTYEQALQESRSNYKAAEEANPIVSTISEVAGSLPTMFIPGLGIAKGASTGAKILSLAKQGAGFGAATGLGKSEAEDLSGLAKDIALGGLVGAGGGAGGGAITEAALPAIGKGISKTSDFLKGKAEDYAARAVGFDKFKIPLKNRQDVSRGIGRTALDEGVVGFNRKGTMFEKAEDLVNESGKKLGEKRDLANSFGKLDSIDLITSLDSEIGDFWRSALSQPEENMYGKLLDTIRDQGSLGVKELNELKKKVSRLANFDKSPDNLTDKEKMFRDAYSVISEQEKKLVGVNLEEDALKGQLQNIFKDVDPAKLPDDYLVKNVDQENFFKNLYTPASEYRDEVLRYSKLEKIKEGLRKKLKSGGQGNSELEAGAALLAAPFGQSLPAAAAAYVGKRVLGSEQVRAKTLDIASKILETAPQKLGKFAAPLMSAKNRGSKAFAVAQNLLSQSNPEFREMLKKAQEEDTK